MENYFKGSLLSIAVAFALSGCGGGGSEEKLDSTQSQSQTPTNSVPVANAGSTQNIQTNTLVTLDGTTSSDADGDSLTFQWSLTSIPEESSATLNDTTLSSPSFTADLDGEYIAQLIVNDGQVNSEAVTVKINAETENSAPVADAGSAQNIQTNTLVTLDGTGSSDADGDSLTYQWSLTSIPEESSAILNDTTLSSPNFTADLDGEYIAQLIVNDGQVNSEAVTVKITAETANSAPVADAGSAQNIQTNTLVTLDGTGSSDADGDSLTYQWSLTSIPEESSAILNDTTLSSPNFTADLDGEYIAQLIVNDGQVNSEAVTVKITAETANSAPVANAGDDKTTKIDEVIYLDGTGSTDADNDELSYSWAFVSKPQDSMAELDNAEVYNPSFIADKSGDYVIALTVSDSIDESERDLIKISAIEPQVRLYREGGSIFDPQFSEVSFPYSTAGSMTVSVTGIPTPTTYTISKFKLIAEGDNFTITNVIVSDANNVVSPYFNGITDGFELAEGTEVEFELVSPLTQNQIANLTFSFEILETGETFNANYSFRSN